MIKRVLLLSALLALFANGFAQPYSARLTGDQMIPPVNSARSALLQVYYTPSGGPTDPYKFPPTGLDFSYFLTTDINDITGLSIYAPAPSDTGPLLIEFTSNLKTERKFIPVAGNYTAISEYQSTLNTYLKIGFAYAILRTTAFPNGELRGTFGTTSLSRGVRFYAKTLFPFAPTDALLQIVFIECNSGFTGANQCTWNSAMPAGGSGELQGPNGLVIPLFPWQMYGSAPIPGLSRTFTAPAPFTVDQLLDFGYRGELRLAYKIGTTEVGSIALSISGKPGTLEANLNGANVVPAVTTSATGKVEISLADPNMLALSHTVLNGTRFSFFSGSAGVNGVELVNILPGLFPIPSDFETQLDFSFQLFDYLGARQQVYSSIASTANPQGEIRGQVILHPNEEFMDTLSGQKMVPAVMSALTGQAVLRYDSILDALYINISSTSTSTSAVLLRGPANADATGPVLATLCSFKCNLRRVFFGVLNEGSGAFASGQTLSSILDVLRQGKVYVELQTTQNPSGELRANLVASTNNNPPFEISPSPLSRPDIDLPTTIPTPVPSIPRFFRRRVHAQ